MKNKVRNAWLTARRNYLKANPPNHQGYYVCYLCGRWIPAADITVDHIIPRSRHTHAIDDPNNLALCCGNCNSIKGSQVYSTIQS